MSVSVELTSPTDGSVVSGAVTVSADAASDHGVTQVAFAVDGASMGTDTSGSDGWSVTWDTTSALEGEHTVTATATDGAGDTASSSTTVIVDNDAAPSVTITSPAEGATVADVVDIVADASDDVAVAEVDFFIDGASIGTDTTGDDGWSAKWDTTAFTDGSHTVAATAVDSAGQRTTDEVGVTVDNGVVAALTVASITPDSASGNMTTDVTISGTGFVTGAAVDLSDGDGPAPVTSNAVVIDSTTMTATITTKSGGPPRSSAWDVVVTNPDGTSAVPFWSTVSRCCADEATHRPTGAKTPTNFPPSGHGRGDGENLRRRVAHLVTAQHATVERWD